MKRKTVSPGILVSAIGFSLLALMLVVCGNGLMQSGALWKAVENNDEYAARAAIEAGAQVDARKHPVLLSFLVDSNPTPLISACKSGSGELAELLVEHGADVNQSDSLTGQTPLLAALHGTKANRFSLAFYLIEHGADTNVVQKTATPIAETIPVLDSDDVTTIQEGFALFRYLIEHDADLWIPMTQENALTYAAHYHNGQVVEYLIQNQYFDVNAKDDAQNTALITAVKAGDAEMVQRLLNLGADPEIKSGENKTAFDYARENGAEEILKLLGA